MKKFISLLLSLVMLLQLLPVSVFADNGSGLRSVDSPVYRGTESYRVTWTVEGETGTYVVEAGSGTRLSDILPSAPSKEGDYRFVGWVDGSGAAVDTDSVIDADISVTAQFEEVFYYQVTFTAEGSEPQAIRVEQNTPIGSQMPDDITRDGYRFDGWYCGDTPVTEATVVDADMTVTAAFTELITVEFDPTTDPAEPLLPHVYTVAAGDTVPEMPAVPDKPGYAGKWAIQGTGTEVTSSTIVEEAFTAVPSYDKISYTATFVNQEAGTTETRTVTVDDSFAVNDVPALPQKDNMLGVWVFQDDPTREFTEGTTLIEDVTLIPKYEQNIFTVEFRIGDSAESSSLYHSATVYKGDHLLLPSAPVKTGAEFKGWYT